MEIRQYKPKMLYVTFSTPESINAINNMLEQNIENGYPYHTIQDPLFQHQGKQISPNTYGTYFKRINDIVGFPRDYNGRRHFHSHGLRKYFVSTIKQSNHISELDAGWLIGHAVGSITDAYKTGSKKVRKSIFKINTYPIH